MHPGVLEGADHSSVSFWDSFTGGNGAFRLASNLDAFIQCLDEDSSSYWEGGNDRDADSGILFGDYTGSPHKKGNYRLSVALET